MRAIRANHTRDVDLCALGHTTPARLYIKVGIQAEPPCTRRWRAAFSVLADTFAPSRTLQSAPTRVPQPPLPDAGVEAG
eukprot:5355879-Pleurochrysis_carterae.AAC.1